jgi:membrane-associated protein
MELIRQFINTFLHLDATLGRFIELHGVWTYLVLFVIVFCETGLVVTPVLPGDSLLFAAGTFAGMGKLNIAAVFLILAAAAILGDTANYWIGKYLGQRIVNARRIRLVKPEHLAKTHEFFERYGGKTIILARFVPIVRTFAPFVAGLGAMTYGQFILYNIVGGLAWVALCVGAGYCFGGMKVVRENFSLVIIAIVFLSVLPAGIEYLRHRRRSRQGAGADGAVLADRKPTRD